MKQAVVSVILIAIVLALTPLSSGAVKQDKVNARANDFASDKKGEIEAKKQEIRQRIEDRKQERTERLADKRLESCKKREVSINNIIVKRVASDEKHLETFDGVRDNLAAFVERKQLDVSAQQALKDAMDTKRANAVQSIDALRAQTFSCTVTAANNPGGVVKEVDKLAREALKDYRAAIRAYAQGIKQSVETEQEGVQ